MIAPTLLIVDASATARRNIARFATHLGLRVVGEASGEQEALALYRKHRPSLVTLELALTTGDGLALARTLREEDRNARIIACGSALSRERALACKEAGVLDYLRKPLDQTLFAHSVAHCFEEAPRAHSA